MADYNKKLNGRTEGRKGAQGRVEGRTSQSRRPASRMEYTGKDGGAGYVRLRKDQGIGRKTPAGKRFSEEKPNGSGKHFSGNRSQQGNRPAQTNRPSNNAHQAPIKKTIDKSKYLCPYVGKCGGCDGVDKSYQAHLMAKQLMERKLLSGFGEVEPIIGMKEPLHYRYKVNRVFGRHNREVVCGTYRAGTHRIVAIEDCLIENEKAVKIMTTIKGLVKALGIEPYDEDGGYGFLRHVQVRCACRTDEVLVTLVTADGQLRYKGQFIKRLTERHPEITSIVQNINTGKTSMVLGDKEYVLYGPGYIHDRIGDCTFRLSSKSFYQVNPIQMEILYSKALELAQLSGKEKVLDAYCGIGTIGMLAAKTAREVVGVELNGDAVADARLNIKENDMKNIKVIKGDAGVVMQKMAAQGEAPDVVFMDPPRSGSDS
ncbi:MAG: 23S rRNA (uracil(1939)-C(5))-methyltransferase RlmD, partial [Lachnospiraceae bacterium]|nr:23S rRNA (uracil(1939)-C(5))-methyltransferase RlmD [Candidatus Equihabitans merdae]